MTMQNEFFTSFMKGVAKTSGSLTVLSVVGILWQIYSHTTVVTNDNNKTNQNNEQNEINETAEINESNETADLECSFIDCQDVDSTKTNFKKIFDKM